MRYFVARHEAQYFQTALDGLEDLVSTGIEEGATPKGGVSIAAYFDSATERTWYTAAQAMVVED